MNCFFFHSLVVESERDFSRCIFVYVDDYQIGFVVCYKAVDDVSGR